MSFSLITPPAVEPLTLAAAKAHLNGPPDEDDALVSTLIKVARQAVEQHTGRALINQTWRLTLDNFSDEMELKAGASSVDQIQYQATDNATQTLATSVYELRPGFIPVIGRKYGQAWPSVLSHPGSVTVEFVAGYGAAADDVPEPIKHAMKMIISQLYEHREEVVLGSSVSQIPMASEYLLAPYRVPVL